MACTYFMEVSNTLVTLVTSLNSRIAGRTVFQLTEFYSNSLTGEPGQGADAQSYATALVSMTVYPVCTTVEITSLSSTVASMESLQDICSSTAGLPGLNV